MYSNVNTECSSDSEDRCIELASKEGNNSSSDGLLEENKREPNFPGLKSISAVLGFFLCALALVLVANIFSVRDSSAVSNRMPSSNYGDLVVNVRDSGEMDVFFKGVNWFSTGEVWISVNGRKYSTRDQTLTLLRPEEAKSNSRIAGIDAWGSYIKIKSLRYVASDDEAIAFTGVVKLYSDQNSIVFEQHFDSQIELGDYNAKKEGLATAFPVFDNTRQSQTRTDQFGYAHYVSWYYGSANGQRAQRSTLVAPGFDTPQYGLFDQSLLLPTNADGSGVLAIFDEQGTATAVLSPLDGAMALSHFSPARGVLAFGLVNKLERIQEGSIFKVVLRLQAGGVNEVMRAWGQSLLAYTGKISNRLQDDTLQYLGYGTQNGAYYYYNTVSKDKNYLETLLAVKAYAEEEQIPYRYVLLDSWWYYRDPINGGVTNWTARTGVFGDGGIEELVRRTNWKVQAHNRYWSSKTSYAIENGGTFPFEVDLEAGGAAPTSMSFWTSLFSNKKREWALEVYEQDWLSLEYAQYVSKMQSEAFFASDWLSSMGSAAKSAGLSIQYCMPYVRHLLFSASVEAVTQARASDDYVVSPYVGKNNWRIGGQSLLLDSLGLAPSKDTFWSVSYQPGNPYGEMRHEKNPRLQAGKLQYLHTHKNKHIQRHTTHLRLLYQKLVVATLSHGPVQIGDGLGYSNSSLIRRSCTKEGLLLQPSHAATTIDKLMLGNAFGSRSASEEIWFASSYVSGTSFGFLFVADLDAEIQISLADLYFVFDRGQDASSLSTEYLVYEGSRGDWHALNNGTTRTTVFSNASPLMLQQSRSKTSNDDGDFDFFLLAPKRYGYSFLGEIDKWVSVSSSRFSSIDYSESGITVKALGSIGEQINVAFVMPNDEEQRVSCIFVKSEKISISSEGKCLDVHS